MFSSPHVCIYVLLGSRNENAHLKHLRKQQEAALSDALHQRSEILKWITEEKLKTEKACEELKQLAAKDRRQAAKVLRDARDQGNSGIDIAMVI